MEGGDRQANLHRHTTRAICLGGRKKEEFEISQGEERLIIQFVQQTDSSQGKGNFLSKWFVLPK